MAATSGSTTLTYTVSMDNPQNHLYHVVGCYRGFPGATIDLRMPAWMPGYYGILNYANNVRNFHASKESGHSLAWEQTTSNTWRVAIDRSESILIAYDVLATTSFVANCYLDEERGYITPAGLIMYVEVQLDHPLTLTIMPNPNWSTITTGLDPVSADRPHTFYAANFDILYDSPILMGNLESLPTFYIRGIPHYFCGHKLNIADAPRFIEDLQAVVRAGVDIIDDIPYNHYTFIGIGPGPGGIEHRNSVSMGFNGAYMEKREGRIGMLSFLAHEYFHNFNVKRIRPLALDPFDYNKPNLTNMLWVSEGFTVYYQWRMLLRARIISETEYLDAFQNIFASYENKTGHLFQSAIQSSLNTWEQGPFGGRGEGLIKTISYYQKGAALGLLLDLKIRHETQNKESLDSVMRLLYQRFYKELQRGWSDDEFRAVCESAAGTDLSEIFTYASTTREIDYDKYLAYAGLELEKPKPLAVSDWGGLVEMQNGKLLLTAVIPGSPAQIAGLATGDEITALNGKTVDTEKLNETIGAKKPGETISLAIVRTGESDRTVAIVLEQKMERSFAIHKQANPDKSAKLIHDKWLKGK
jgi:predicted metalloprotease with PDZ domain